MCVREHVGSRLTNISHGIQARGTWNLVPFWDHSSVGYLLINCGRDISVTIAVSGLLALSFIRAPARGLCPAFVFYFSWLLHV